MRSRTAPSARIRVMVTWQLSSRRPGASDDDGECEHGEQEPVSLGNISSEQESFDVGSSAVRPSRLAEGHPPDKGTPRFPYGASTRSGNTIPPPIAIALATNS